MLHSTRRLLTGNLHPLERDAAVELVSQRGGPEDAEALLPRLLDADEPDWSLIDPVVRCGDRAMVEALYDRFVKGGELAEGADPDLLWAFGWAGLGRARPMLFRSVLEMDWDLAPRALDGLVHLSPKGLEDQVRAAVRPLVGQSVFAEFVPALAGWIGEAELLDPFVYYDGRTLTPSTTCMSGVVLGLGLLGPAGRSRLSHLFWEDQYPMIWDDAARATGMAMRMTGLTVTDLAAELRTRLASSDDSPEHWWFVLIRDMAAHQARTHATPAAWRFLPPSEPALDLFHAVFGPDGGWTDDSLPELAMKRLGLDAEWLSGEIHDLRRPILDLVARDVLLAEMDAA